MRTPIIPFLFPSLMSLTVALPLPLSRPLFEVSATSTVANETTTDLTEAKKHLEKANGWLESTLERLRQIRAQQQQDLEIIATLPEEADVGTIGRKIREMRQRIEERRRLRH